MIFGVGQGRNLQLGVRETCSYTHHPMTHPPLRYDIVWVALTEPSTLEKVHHISLAGTLLVQAVLVLLETDGAAKNDFIATRRKAVVRVVKDNLH